MSTTPANSYQVKRKVTGGYVVSYACPHCATALTSTLDEAGTPQACPTCNKQFVVPGKAEREHVKSKQEQERREKEQRRLEQEQEAKKAAAAKEVARLETQRLNQIAKQDEAAAAERAHAQHQKHLLIARGREVSENRDNTRQPISLQVILLILAINALVSAFAAVITAMTIIGLPLAAGFVACFVVNMSLYSLLVMVNNIRHAANETVEHLRFQSSVLSQQLQTAKHDN
jgi:uncharacterized Zn finger protein (UPF0148 family)